jgi:EAL domain-containing protein (putative c-di-GMP-specific phosphodiesterase class I)
MMVSTEDLTEMRPAGESIPLLLPSAILDVEEALHTVRNHLGMDVAFISEFIGDERIFRHVDTKGKQKPIQRGQRLSLEEGYCKRIVEGRLPQLIPDTAKVPETAEIPATMAMPIGSHISVPLRLADGRIYGTFCCFGFHADPTLNERDLHLMQMFADLIAQRINSDLDRVRDRAEKLERIETALRTGQPRILYQPIVRLSDHKIVGAEALSRFAGEPALSPDKWFLQAAEIGLRTKLELQAINHALAGFRPIWSKAPIKLSLNISPATLMESDMVAVFAGMPLDRLILEITEHEVIEDYGALHTTLAPLRAKGMQVAIDDAGAGYSSMRQVLNVKPDIIKLDISLTRNIHAEPSVLAMAKALVAFSRETGSQTLSEGIEQEVELEALQRLGIDMGQGYLMARPMPPEALAERLDDA